MGRARVADDEPTAATVMFAEEEGEAPDAAGAVGREGVGLPFGSCGGGGSRIRGGEMGGVRVRVSSARSCSSYIYVIEQEGLTSYHWTQL